MESSSVTVPKFFVTKSLLACSFFAFLVGYGARSQLDANMDQWVDVQLPAPFLPAGKAMPKVVYSSMDYMGSPQHTPTTSQLSLPNPSPVGEAVWHVTQEGNRLDIAAEDDDDEPELDYEELHLPSGQHLMVDMKNIDREFLSSEKRLAEAMIELVKGSGLTLLSYHCHPSLDGKVSCVGVLLESHVAFHTRPSEGTITLDLFTCGESPLLPLIPTIQRLFGSGKPVDQSDSIWIHKKRGFRSQSDRLNPEDVDLERWLLGLRRFASKELLVSVESPFQKIDIFDVTDSRHREPESYKKALSGDDSYESRHAELYRHDKVVYLDNIMQSRLYGETAYHEALVHPAIVTHTNPKRVAIVGGGEGATLRECLKWNTVEEVVMLEIDEVMVNASRTFLPEWSDCSNLEGSAESCFDDPRANVIYTDAIAYFLDRYGNSEQIADSLFDVVILDALDPSSAIEFSDILYDNEIFVRSLYNSLTSNGILVSQVGEGEGFGDAALEMSATTKPLQLFIQHLKQVGFQSIEDFTEAHGGFAGPWGYLIAFKAIQSLASWHRNEAEISLDLMRRAKVTTQGELPFLYFDGASMQMYQQSSRIAEDVFCLSRPSPFLCDEGHGFNPTLPVTAAALYNEAVDASIFVPAPTRSLMSSQRVLQKFIEASLTSSFFGQLVSLMHPWQMLATYDGELPRRDARGTLVDRAQASTYVARNVMRLLSSRLIKGSKHPESTMNEPSNSIYE